MAIIQSGDGSENALATIDPTAKALRVLRMGVSGLNDIPDQNAPGYYSSQKVTYAAAMAAKAVQSSAGVGPFFAFYGSPKKLIRILRLTVSVTLATTAAYVAIVVNKRYSISATPVGPTTLLTPVPFDSLSPQRSTVNFIGNYNPATNTIGQGPTDTIASAQRFAPVTGTPARLGLLAQEEGLFDFNFMRGEELVAPVLTSFNHGIEVQFDAAPGTAATYLASILWTEE